MAPLLLALLLLAQDGPVTTPVEADGPVSTAAPRKQTAAPLPIQGGPVSPPADDYGYVGWCYGALSGYVDLYDTAMPEVIRIERAWPTPSTEENINTIYPGQKKDALEAISLFKRAIEAAEKASPTPITNQGAAAIKKGRAVWTGSNTVPKAQLAQFWMSWSPPSKCEETAKALEARSNLFGQALTYNAKTGEAPVPAVEAGREVDIQPVAPVATDGDPGPEATADVVEAPADEATDAVKDEVQAGETAAAPGEDAQGASPIDALVPDATEEPATETAPATEETRPEDATPAETPKAPATKPAAKKPTPKPGLRDTLKGLRGTQ